MSDAKKATVVYSGTANFVDLYNQAVVTVARRPKKKRVVAKKAVLTTTTRNVTDTITAYAALKQSEGQGITVSDILAMMNDPTIHNAIYGDNTKNYAIQESYYRVDANIVMAKLAKRIDEAKAVGMTVPLILANDYFGTIIGFISKIIEDMQAEKRETW